MNFGCVLVFASAIISWPIGVSGDVPDGKSKVDVTLEIGFNRHIRPIFAEKCYTCHGPDAGVLKGGLQLQSFAAATKRLESGRTAIVAGDVRLSAMIERINATDTDRLMPPPDSGFELTDLEKQRLRLWIEKGAEYQPHWSYIPPRAADLPAVKHKRWVRNDVDRFILAELEKRGLEPSEEADRVTLMRRVSFDLIGLPPTSKELSTFLNDDSADAYENLVDRLLASPHYGERMAVQWLDLVRYADTVGYHGDQPMKVHPYRDYVIDAFNDNMPFDRFTREQLAGDLLPEATLDQKIASGYNRLNMMTREGGAQDKEYRAKYAADRVRTTSSVWLGATLGCAECHDHKFDPFSTRDFYSMAAFFADIDELGDYSKSGPNGDPNWGPKILVPNMEQSFRVRFLDHQIDWLQDVIATATPELIAEQEMWESHALEVIAAQQPPTIHAWFSVGPFRDKDFNDAFANRFEPERRLDAGAPDFDGPLRWIEQPDWQDGKIHMLTGDNSATYLYRKITSPIDQPLELSLGSDDSIKVWLNGEEVLSHHVPRGVAPDQERITVALQAGDNHLIMKIVNGGGGYGFYFKPMKPGPPDEIEEILRVPNPDRDEAQLEKVANYHRSISPALQPARDELAAVQKDKAGLIKSIPTTLVTVATEPRVTRVYPRGDWLDDSGEEVQPAIPSNFGKLTVAGERASRLDLADWLVSDENPLTARVVVNRLWKMCFGKGLARDLDDLGSRGAWPTHPELLDNLTVEFVKSGWDVKRMIRHMVTSATYRQSSTPSETLTQLDPENRLLARQARFRLDAEFVRDNALVVSGLLVAEIGGPSVRPYQPPGYWEPLNFPKRTYKHDTGNAQYRRGLYTHWQRAFLHPSMVAFDAPPREECTAERLRSNTPLQALVLLNDPTYVEAARKFAERIMNHETSDVSARVSWAYQQALGRIPDPRAAQVLASVYRDHLSDYADDEEAAAKLIAVGESSPPESIDVAELAAWTSVARVILNLHETITRY